MGSGQKEIRSLGVHPKQKVDYCFSTREAMTWLPLI